jgi:hypothetical protein
MVPAKSKYADSNSSDFRVPTYVVLGWKHQVPDHNIEQVHELSDPILLYLIN